MAKMIRLTPEEVEKVKEEFEKALQGSISDGKINFQKTFGSVQRKAELRFSEKAWYKMQALVRECDKEVGWHGVARRLEEPGKDAYLIEDIFVYPQMVTGATITTNQKEYEAWLNKLPDEVFNNMRMQGHSHVNMGVSPSGTDISLYERTLQQVEDTMFQIFLIWNKRNEHHIKIYDMEKNILFETGDITVSVIPEENGLERFVSDAKKMIIEEKPVPQNTVPAVYGYGGAYNAAPSYTPVVTPVKTTESAKKTTQTVDLGDSDNKKKTGKKHRVGDGRKLPAVDSKKNFYVTDAYGTVRCEDDNPYGPFGYREYYGYDY